MDIPFQINSLEEYSHSYLMSVEQPELFWATIAENFSWKIKWHSVLDWDFSKPKINWFNGATLNITENCLDRHLHDKADQPAIIWEPNHPSESPITLSYKQLYDKVCIASQAFREIGIRKGDRVCIYMPMVPELAIAVLACARIGAVHSVVFGGFSAQSIADRIHDASCKYVVTADGAFRGEKIIPLKNIMDEALAACPEVEKCMVVTRTKSEINLHTDRDLLWEELMLKAEANPNADLRQAEEMQAEDILFILYTSGSTGKPKGVVHTCAGYMVYATYTFVNVFQYKAGQVHFCTADIGWVTGHSYILYGPLCCGATTLMFEGVPTYPDAGRFWDIVDKHRVNILYTAPTAIRSLMTFGEKPFEGKQLTSLQVLGSVGEPINEEAWHWYNEQVGKENCPIVDTWWQTETGGILISPLANITQTKPGYATLPLPGVQPILVDENGKEIIGNNVSGNLCIKFPWPGILRTTYNDHERCRLNYFSTYPGMYFTGDGCRRDADGYYRITGRVDDVMNVSGHRIGTAEVENAINEHNLVIESAVVGYTHEIKGQGIYSFAILSIPLDTITPAQLSEIKSEIIIKVSHVIGSHAKPDKIQFVAALPKTRSGKIMRRILRKIADGDVTNLGDTTTLLDPSVVEQIINGRV